MIRIWNSGGLRAKFWGGSESIWGFGGVKLGFYKFLGMGIIYKGSEDQGGPFWGCRTRAVHHADFGDA